MTSVLKNMFKKAKDFFNTRNGRSVERAAGLAALGGVLIDNSRLGAKVIEFGDAVRKVVSSGVDHHLGPHVIKNALAIKGAMPNVLSGGNLVLGAVFVIAAGAIVNNMIKESRKKQNIRKVMSSDKFEM